VFVFGGYDVATGGSETSHAEMSSLDLQSGLWKPEAPLPVAIDDAAAVVLRDRYIVVVSGWSNTAPVRAVQVYDALNGLWSHATPFPGTPVFGHAAAARGDDFVVIDGVAQTAAGYAIVAQAWKGHWDPALPNQITWSALPAHPGRPLYRAAAIGPAAGALLFTGGTTDPYNFDGLSYRSKKPSQPEDLTLSYAFEGISPGFRALTAIKPEPTMDHRALARCGSAGYSVGGMVRGATVTANVWKLE
jgi:hypothetical protein